MKRSTIVAATIYSLVLTTSLWAQTVSGTTSTQSSASGQTNTSKTSVDSRQENNVRVQRQGKSASVNASSQSQNNASSNVGGNSLNLQNGAQFNAILNNTLDTRQAAEGQQFLLKTTKAVKANGQTVLAKGSTLVGHVVKAQRKTSGESNSQLALMIDGVKQGEQIIPMQAVFVGMVQQTVQSSVDSDLGAMPAVPVSRQSSGGGLLGGGGGLVGGVASSVSNTVSQTGQTVGGVTNGVARSGATGAVSNTVNGTVSGSGNVASGGIINEPGRVLFSLSNGVTATTSGSLTGATEFTRAGKDLKLDKGTEFVLAVAGNNQASTSTPR